MLFLDAGRLGRRSAAQARCSGLSKNSLRLDRLMVHFSRSMGFHKESRKRIETGSVNLYVPARCSGSVSRWPKKVRRSGYDQKRNSTFDTPSDHFDRR
jgi:hypothetical protein